MTKNLEFVKKNTLDTIMNTEIKVSNIHGFGLFATKNIEKDTILTIFDGQILTEKEYKSLINRLSVSIPELKNYFFMECNKLDINTFLTRAYRTKYSYINHSFTPNTYIIKYPLRLVSLKKIFQGEELTVDYTREELSQEYLEQDEKQFLRR